MRKTHLLSLLIGLFVSVAAFNSCKKFKKPEIVKGRLALPSWLADGEFYDTRPYFYYDSSKDNYIETLTFFNDIDSCIKRIQYNRGSDGLFSKKVPIYPTGCEFRFEDLNRIIRKSSAYPERHYWVQEITKDSYMLKCQDYIACGDFAWLIKRVPNSKDITIQRGSYDADIVRYNRMN